jgi:hypothetical protein
MAGRTLDRILEQGLGTAPRDELLRALEEHTGKPVTLAIELPDGSDLVTAWGILLGKGAQEEEVFTIDGDEGYVFALSHGWEDQERHETVTLHQVPKGQIDRYAGQEKGRSGYRIHLEGGIDLGLVLWAQDPHDPLEAVN